MIRPLLIALFAFAAPAAGDTLRMATYNPEMTRNGAGVLLHELEEDASEEIAAAVAVIRAVRPDILLLSRFDHDLHGRALEALRALLRQGPAGLDYPHAFHRPVNAGTPSGLDLDSDGLLMGPDDAYGWGRFPGHGGMALLSRFPIDAEAVRTFRTMLWQDLPGAQLPATPDGQPWPDTARQAAMRLSSRSHWEVPVILPDDTRLHLLAAGPTPPLFDGPEGRNRLRNHDEVAFWVAYLDGADLVDDRGRREGRPEGPVVVLGDLNIDPDDGAGDPAAIRRLLVHPRLQDPRPRSDGAARAGAASGANARHVGDPGLDTADWRDGDDGPGNLRVDYVLPDARLDVTGAGVLWPAPGAPLAAEAATASAHRLVWVDVDLP